MARGVNIDGVLVTWGDRLFYPGNRMVKGGTQPKLRGDALRRRAAAIRAKIEATVVRRAPQAMVKVTGGGRCVRAIAAHFRYISKNGRLEIEDDRGESIRGAQAVRDLADDWRFSGSLIPNDVPVHGRREAFNIMLSMPRGTDPLAVLKAARAFARAELAGHKYVMVLHDHQANPHVHVSVRAEATIGKRLNPRKADLARWRGVFAEKLRDLGVEAEASSRTARFSSKRPEVLWKLKARADGRLHVETSAGTVQAARTQRSSSRTDVAWARIADALAVSDTFADRALAAKVHRHIQTDLASEGQKLTVRQGGVPSLPTMSDKDPHR